MRILIVRLGAMGDIIHTLPLAADLQNAGHEVHWLCEDRWSVLLKDNPLITRVWELPRSHWKKNNTRWHERRQQTKSLTKSLREQRFDATIDAQGLAKSGIWQWRVGAPQRVSYKGPRAREGLGY